MSLGGSPRKVNGNRVVVEVRPQISEAEKELMFMAVVRRESVFLKARVSMNVDFFASDEMWLKMVWLVLVKHYDDFEEMPTVGLLGQLCNAQLELDPSAMPDGDDAKLDAFLTLAENMREEDLPDYLILSILKRFLEDRLLFAARSSFAHMQTPVDLPGSLAAILADAVAVRSLGGNDDLLQDCSLADFLGQDHRIKMLVENLVPKGEPGILSGKMKSCKSSVAADLFVSLATGTMFLDHFLIPKPTNVGIISCESGQPVLQNTLNRISTSKGLPDDWLAKSATARISTVRPNLLKEEWLAAIERFITKNKLELLIIDPVYLMTPGAEQNTLASMAEALGPLSDICRRTGCGILLVHHNRKNDGTGKRFGKPSLEEIVGSGYGEFARYWILLGKRAEWDEARGNHELHLVAGSNFYGGHYRWLNIHEGRSDNQGGRVWEVKVKPPGETDAERLERQLGEDREYYDRFRRVIAELGGQGKLPASRNNICKAVGGNRQKATEAINKLLTDGVLAEARIPGKTAFGITTAEGSDG